LLGRLVPPAQFAGAAVETEDDELVIVGRGLCALLEARVEFGQLVGVCGSISRGGGDDEDLIAPDDGGGAATAGQLGLPPDVGLLIPVERWVSLRGGAVGERTTPVMPVVQPLLVQLPSRSHRSKEEEKTDRRVQRSHRGLRGALLSPRAEVREQVA